MVAALLPAWIFLAVLIGYPLVKVLIDGFSYSNLVNPSVSGFAGTRNYSDVFADPHFTGALKNSVIWTVGSVLGEYMLGLGSAVLLNRRLKGRGIFRMLTFIPWLVPIIVAGMTWEWMLNPDFGIINSLLVRVGICDSPVNFLGSPSWAMPTVVFVNIWRSFPYYTITFLAALQAIPPELKEAAQIDGASAWRSFWSVTFPQLRSPSLIIVFMHLIWTAVNFDFIWVMTQGGPNYATMTLPLLIYRYSMQDFNVGMASALSTVMLLGTSVIFVVYYRLRRNLSEEIVG
ncbi:carbohydrate ABC transporter permease [Actinomyces glycerinitolerans]|uniref:carbohydrate ABC transporter permease n=1 Tax=Actinomyces glycerinitolerans TaxID=1892869 RepID=UPI000932FBC2|nr:sugar ABC transporter permease [Actinomyces glycerinitolerans]